MGLNVTVEGKEGDLRPVQHDLLRSGRLKVHSTANFGAFFPLYRPPIDFTAKSKDTGHSLIKWFSSFNFFKLKCIKKYSDIIRKGKTSFVCYPLK